MTVRHLSLLQVVILAVTSCQQSMAGPQPPSATALAEIRVEALPPEASRSHTINDPGKIQSISESYAISPEGWFESRGRELRPLYRIELIAEEGERTTYWLGANSHPPRFPCYSLCSGWWVAASNVAGDMDATLYKGLPDSVYFYFLRDLDIH